MVIDIDKKYILTNYKQAKYGGKATDSDHFTEFVDMDLKVIREKPKRCEIWNFKNKEAQDKFKDLTSVTTDFSGCFENNLPVFKQIEMWRSALNLHISNAFKKVRITKKKYLKPPPQKISNLIDVRNELSKKDGPTKEINQLDEEISNLEAEFNQNIIKEQFQRYSEDPENDNLQQVWKTMGKLWPKVGATLPAGKKNHSGRIISEP